MKIQKCDGCHAQFKWSKILKSLWIAYRPIQCNQCGVNHKITFPSRIITSFTIIIPTSILGTFILNNFNVSITFAVASMILLSILTSFLCPFLVKYRSE